MMDAQWDDYIKFQQDYETKFGVWEFGEDDCLLPIDIISKFMSYCLKIGKPYAQLTDAEYDTALEA